jgi:chromosome segregation ATPase
MTDMKDVIEILEAYKTSVSTDLEQANSEIDSLKKGTDKQFARIMELIAERDKAVSEKESFQKLYEESTSLANSRLVVMDRLHDEIDKLRDENYTLSDKLKKLEVKFVEYLRLVNNTFSKLFKETTQLSGLMQAAKDTNSDILAEYVK